MKPEFKIIKKSAFPVSVMSTTGGRFAVNPIVTLHMKQGNLSFSKLAKDTFGPRKYAVISADEDNPAELCISAVEKAPKGLQDEDLFNIAYQIRNGKEMAASIAVRRLLRFLNLTDKVQSGKCKCELDAANYSVYLSLPLIGSQPISVEGVSDVESEEDDNVEWTTNKQEVAPEPAATVAAPRHAKSRRQVEGKEEN